MRVRYLLKCAGVFAGLGSGFALVGCGDVAGVGGVSAGTSMQGYLHGGQQPITGANVYMYAAGTSGYGQGATNLLSDGYVMTDANGSFSITGDYTCPSATSQVYLVAKGGNTGSGTNSKAVLMAALGDCGNLTPSTFINMSEVSSVVSVYALSPFMTPGSTDVGTSSTNVIGMRNAFATVNNLVDISKGQARTTTPAGNGAVPQSTIYTLANIMAACVNTTGGAGACPALFSAATPPGGTAPTETLSAMLNVARNPGINVQALYNVPAPKAAFQPSLTTAPNDWTLSVEFTGGGLSYPELPAVDAAGNLWVPNAVDPGTLSEFSPVGVPLSGTSGFSGGGLSYPLAAAVDLRGNVWAANQAPDSVSEHTSAGVPLSGSGFTANGMVRPSAIAVDGAGNVFTANANSSMTKLDSTGVQLAQITDGGLSASFAVAIDPSQNAWIANSYGATVSKFSNSGTAMTTAGYGGGGLSDPSWVAIDAGGNAWVSNFSSSVVSKFTATGSPISGAGFSIAAPSSTLAIDGSNTVWTANTDGSISHLTNTGSLLSPADGYISAGATGEVGIVVDASGNVWTTDIYADSLFQYVGAASPAMVPLVIAVKNNQLGVRP